MRFFSILAMKFKTMKMKKNILFKTCILCLFLISNTVLFSQISFTTSPGSGCGPLVVTFTNTSTDPNAYRYEWSFNDGSPIFIDTMPTTFTHTYTSAGYFSPYVMVYNSSGGYVGYNYGSNGSIQVNGASISSVDSACIGDMVNFCANGNNVNSASWNFGDPASGINNTSGQFCTQHAFSANGTYTVTLNTNSSCGSTTATKTIIVGNGVYPHPSAWADPNPSCPAMPVKFNTEGYASYSWNFADPASGANNTSTLQYPQHTYSGLGVFTASLTVTNGCGHSASTTNAVTIVSSPAFPNQSWFNLQSSSPSCPNSSVSFNAGQGYNSYQWNFGDGSSTVTTSDNHTEHTYGSTPGTYSASVKITSPCGNDTTLYTSVIISNTAPFPNQSWFKLNTSAPACPGSYVNFEVPGGYNSYVWDFGDGSPQSTTTNRNNYHLYGNTLTSYTASVKITNGCGNDTTLYATVQIMSNVGFPNDSYFTLDVSPNPTCQNDAVGLNAPSGYSSYVWGFGDGNTSTTTSNHATHTYASTGTYVVSVTISNNCGNDTTLYSSVTVNNTGSFPNWLSIDAEPQVSCANDLIEFKVNQNGFASYSWDFGDGNTITTTGERIQHAYTTTGTYTVTCTVTNGCGSTTTITGTIQVSGSSPVNPNLNISGIQNPSCPNDNVFFIVNEGQSTYTYIWNFGDGSAADTTVGAGTSHRYTSAGSYIVTATAINGCGSSLTVTTTQVISNSAMPSLTNENGERTWGFPGSEGHDGQSGNTTAGCANDAIVFYFEGEAANNVYNFGDGTTGTAVDHLVVYGGDGSFPVTIIKHAFPANGDYVVSLTLTNGCGNSVTDSMTIHIGGGLPVEGDMTTSPPPFSTCAPIDFLAFGGADYSWNFGDGSTLSTSSSTVSHTFASSGIYVVSVLVTNGCGNTATFSRSLNVTGVGGPAVTLSSAVSPTCVNGSNGSATVSVTSGEPPYVYAWNDPAGQTTATATNLPAGLYYATVTDNIGCASTLAVNVSDPSPIIPSILTTTTACGAATGTATVSVSSGGSGSYDYLWSTGITTATATGLATGTYSVTITDAVTGCTSSATASISENGGATVALNTVTNPSCYGSATGSIDINVSGGTAPYTYLWSNSSTSQDPTGLAAGNYSVTVTDNSGCHATLNATVSQPTAIAVTTSVVTAPTCGNFDGKATASASGGAGPYTYLWSNGGQTTQTAVGLPAGTYTVTVTDAAGCAMDGTIDLSNSNAPNISAAVTNVSCFGGSNGAVDITVTGGTSPYLYTWNVNPPQTNHQDVNGLAPGSYYVFVNDAHGCMSFRSYTITQPSLLTASITTMGATCGNNDGTATAVTSGGNTSFTYAWSGGQSTQTVSGLALGSYSVTVTDNKGCSATASTSITATTLPQDICMVTVDSASTHNIIYWEKPAVTNIDSFRIYREDVTNVYTYIGSVSYNALSEYHDYGVDPNTTTKRYKISALDNCGGESVKSNYHNTIYIVDNGSGQFTWNPLYTIENSANPVDNYRLMRDDNNTNSWSQVAITAGTQNTLVDPSYASYPNGRWYVETVWGITCDPTRATVNTTRSNIKHALSVGIQTPDLANSVMIYPNPASDNVMIELPSINESIIVKIMNPIGQVVYDQVVTSSPGTKTVKQVNTAAFAKGVYTVTIETGTTKVFKKLVIN